MTTNTSHVKPPYVIGPNGEKRPHSVTANAVHVMEILTGGRQEEYVTPEQLQAKRRREERRRRNTGC